MGSTLNSFVRAQFWSFDVIFAIVIFSVAITILALTWYGISTQLSLAYGGGAVIAQIQDQALAQQLFSPGYPYNWQSGINTTNTMTWVNESGGLATAPGSYNLSAGKIYTLLAMNGTSYQATKQFIGVGYDYYILIKGGSMNIAIGENPAAHSTVSEYVQNRAGFVDGQPVNVQVIIWTGGLIAVS